MVHLGTGFFVAAAAENEATDYQLMAIFSWMTKQEARATREQHGGGIGGWWDALLRRPEKGPDSRSKCHGERRQKRSDYL